jgi:hypothetical protein
MSGGTWAMERQCGTPPLLAANDGETAVQGEKANHK